MASGLNGGYEKRVCRLESRTSYRSERHRTSHAVVARLAWHLAGGTERNRLGSDEKCRLYRETGRGARSFEDSAWLISADQPRDKFMCRPEIYVRTRRMQERERRKKRAVIQDTRRPVLLRFHLCPWTFLPCARLHADSIPNRKRQRIH